MTDRVCKVDDTEQYVYSCVNGKIVRLLSYVPSVIEPLRHVRYQGRLNRQGSAVASTIDITSIERGVDVYARDA